MGWGTWLASCDPRFPSGSRYACHDYCTDELVLGAATALVDHGLRDAGYRTVMIADCWAAATRTPLPRQEMQANASRFPRGMAPVVKDLAALGLRTGLCERDNPPCVL